MSDRKKIAAIITEYRVPAHADVIVGKFIKGFPTDEGMQEPQVDIVSMYLDQIPDNDIGLKVSEKYNIPIFLSIPKALCLGGDKLAVDGVLSIGEHGNYAFNEKGQHLYPRRHFFEQISGVMATSGRSVPVFSDKHLSYNWIDSKWIYDRAVKLNIPLMAGSSLPLGWRDPWLEHDLNAPIEEALIIGYGGIESYGYHGFEALQTMVERRQGGECGIATVQCLEGDSVWRAGVEGLWSQSLANAAANAANTESGPMDEACEHPIAFLLEYRDGFRATVLQLNGFIKEEWSYAARTSGRIEATAIRLPGPPHPHFSYLGLNIQEMFLSHKPQYPVERTLLVSGGLDALMESRHLGHVRLETPHLSITYRAPDKMPIRPTIASPKGASLSPFDPMEY